MTSYTLQVWFPPSVLGYYYERPLKINTSAGTSIGGPGPQLLNTTQSNYNSCTQYCLVGNLGLYSIPNGAYGITEMKSQ